MEEAEFLPYQPGLVQAGSALVIAPHADDEVIGCGGAILRHVAAGDAVDILVLTEPRDPGAARRRRAEAEDAAHELGARRPKFLEYPDRALSQRVDQLGDALAQHIAAGPYVSVYVTSAAEAHPDHHAAALALQKASALLDDQTIIMFYEVGVPLAPNFLLDITDLAVAKECALSCYQSQLAERRYDRHMRALGALRAYTLDPQVLLAEAYLRRRPCELRSHAGLFGRSRAGA